MRTILPALLLSLAACGPPTRDHEVWRFAIEETQGSVQDRYARRFAELVEERTGGEVQVTVYPYGTLGTSNHVTELLHNGTLEFAMASPGHLGTIIPEVQVLMLHFVLSGDAEVNARALSDPALHAALGARYAEKGFELLSIFSEGWMVWTLQTEVRAPADFEGVKIRTMTSPLPLASYRAYGASPTPLPYSEVYSALQLSMIDAQVNPIFAIQEMSFYEVTSWMISPRLLPFVTTAAANLDFYEELPPARRQLVDDVIGELQPWIMDLERRYNQERRALILERRPELNVATLTDEEREAFREASMPVREQFVEMAGPQGAEVLEILLAAVERAEEAVAAERIVSPEGQVP